jgi:hypothetical protein
MVSSKCPSMFLCRCHIFCGCWYEAADMRLLIWGKNMNAWPRAITKNTPDVDTYQHILSLESLHSTLLVNCKYVGASRHILCISFIMVISNTFYLIVVWVSYTYNVTSHTFQWDSPTHFLFATRECLVYWRIKYKTYPSNLSNSTHFVTLRYMSLLIRLTWSLWLNA